MTKKTQVNVPRLSLILCFLLLVSGCARYSDLPPGSHSAITAIDSAVVSSENVTVPSMAPEPPPARDYRVGAGDVILLDVNGRPEFTVASPGAGGKVQGSRVDGAGNLHVPMLGAVPVAGLTISEIEQKLTTLLKKYLQEPWVVAEVAEYKSQPLYLLGQFRGSGTHYMDRPLTLLQGISLGNGFDSSASLKGARLMRNGKTLPVDLYTLLHGGDIAQNVWLKPGDTIYLPDNRNQMVFIFGAVKKPGPVPITPGGLNLAQAIASAELRETGYDFHHVRIIRSLSATRGELMVVDFDRVLRGESLPIPLSEGDIIYVPKSGFGTWNDVIADILPSLQTISAVLQPFVSIRYLQKN